MGAMGGGELMPLDKMQEKSAHEERIVVSVRLRPLNAKEIGRNDVSDWECINDNTIIYRSSLSERSMYPTAYSFDRVFRADCPTRQVYEEAAKEVALSVVSGVNASIFAYGQTSSGKTYTMSGITEFTVTDIYDFIEKHQERAFVLRFSAMEIYNEAVRDLLSPDGTPLRLLDDPERGTVVDKLTEETLRDLSHLRELLSVCETQRQIGETSLNEASSRSHQILRLTIESSAREFLGRDNSSTLAASVDFVDLAGSERASQTLSAGTRLKEGCHINRSLLTLGTVIRKLSKGRNGHIPYRDSKLTRILQSSLGGNAKTAIICTISPARSHVEQSRNTLSFANCAKEVSTNAQVNVVMSDKALVKHLQKELERLESELRVHSPKLASYDSMALLREKDFQIEKMEKEISELTRQRDIAKARLENLVQSIEDEQASGLSASPLQNTWVDGYPMSDSPSLNDENYADIGITRFKPSPNLDRCSESSSIKNYLDLPENQVDEFLMKGNASSLFSLNHPSLTDPDSGQENEKIRQVSEEDSEEACKEVRCIETAEPSTNVYVESSAFLPEEGEDMLPLTVTGNEATMDQEIRAPSWKGEREFRNNNTDSTTGTMEQKPQDVQKTIDCLVNSVTDAYSSKSLKLTRSRSCRASLMSSLSSSSSGKGEQDENMTPNYSEDFLGRLEGFDRKSSLLHDRANSAKSFRHESPATEQDISMDELKEHKSRIPVGADISSIGTYAADLKGADKFQYKSKHVDDQGTAPKANKIEKTEKDVSMDTMQDSSDCPSSWSFEFSRQQRDIIELWQTCNVSLVHRTYFFLLFKGDPADSIYMEVELRRLSFLKEAFCQGNLGKLTMDGDQDLTPASSMKALRREREMLSRQMQKRFSEKERRNLYQAWGIGLNTKQRRVQLVRRLWTDTKDMDHIMESANLVAKLVGLLEPGQAPKEMFGLSFLPRQPSRRSYSWKK